MFGWKGNVDIDLEDAKSGILQDEKNAQDGDKSIVECNMHDHELEAVGEDMSARVCCGEISDTVSEWSQMSAVTQSGPGFQNSKVS